MTNTILTWTVPVVALAALAGLWRSTDHASRRVWRSLAVITALGSTVIMALIAIPGETVLAKVLAGAPSSAAILFGTALWLSLSALLVDEYRRPGMVKRNANDRALWHDVTRELTSQDSLDTMLLNIAAAFRRDVDGACAHVFKISTSRRQAYRAGTVYSDHAFGSHPGSEHGRLLAELAWWGAQERVSAMVSGAGGTPIMTLPLCDDQKTYGIIMIENPEHSPHADWQPLTAMVARTISDWSELALYRDSGKVAQRMTALMPALLQEQRIEGALNIIDTAMQGVIDYDYVSVSTLGASRAHEDRATMLSGSNRVIESRHRWPVAGVTLHRVLSTGRAVITPDLDMATDDDETDNTPWERHLGMRSRMIAPIADGGKVLGSITLAHRRYGRFSETEMELVATIAAFLAPWMRQLDSSRRASRTDRALTFLRKLESSIFATLDDKAIVNDASAVLDATGLRIYRIDDSRQTLVEVASSGRLPAGSDGPRQLPLSSLPWHRLALDSRRTLMVNQGDPEAVMGGAEAALAMDTRMKTGCLVPIIGDGRALGVIDVLEHRHPDRNVLDNGSKLILETLASMLAQRWAESDAKPSAQDSATGLNERLKGWSRQVVNPLTSIIGSVELIRYKEPRMSAEMIKYLGTIERSATRIHESLLTILTEAAANTDKTSIPASRERWTWSRTSERIPAESTEFARPASLTEAVMRQSDMPASATGSVTPANTQSTVLG